MLGLQLQNSQAVARVSSLFLAFQPYGILEFYIICSDCVVHFYSKIMFLNIVGNGLVDVDLDWNESGGKH